MGQSSRAARDLPRSTRGESTHTDPESNLASLPSLGARRTEGDDPNRAYFLFRGSLAEFGDWGAADRRPGGPRDWMPDPVFIWPADHAWCIADDVDPHYAGIGADTVAIDRLLAHPELDVVLADPGAEQPDYR